MGLIQHTCSNYRGKNFNNYLCNMPSKRRWDTNTYPYNSFACCNNGQLLHDIASLFETI